MNKQVDDRMDILSTLFSHQVNNQDLIQNLKENPGSFIVAADHLHNVILLHQVSMLGPSMFLPEKYILAMSGAGSTASCFCIHLSSFSTQVEETPCPTWFSLKGAMTSTDL